VYGTTTRADKITRISELGGAALVLDGLDASAVRSAVAEIRPEAIIHEMTALTGKPDFKHFDRWFAKTNDLRTAGTRILLDAALETGTVKRFVAQSYAGWTHAADNEGPITEEEPFDTHPLPQQRETLAAIRQLEQAVLASAIEGVVLRYANLYSPDGMADNVRMLMRRQFPVVGNGAGVWSWLHAEDAAGATAAALENGTRGIYNVADDDPAPVSTWLPYLAGIVDAPRPIRVPVWIGRLVAGDVAVRMMTRVRGVSNAKSRRDLGWRPTHASWREGFTQLAEARPAKELVHVPIS
jgi:nucleoside-diphosphate-sugar epimerase